MLKTKRIVGYQLSHTFHDLKKAYLSETITLTYPEQFVVAFHLTKAIIKKISATEEDFKRNCALAGTRESYVIRSVEALAAAPRVERLAYTKQAILCLLKPEGSFTVKEIEGALFSIIANEFFKENPDLTVSGLANCMGIGKEALYPMMRGLALAPLYSKESVTKSQVEYIEQHSIEKKLLTLQNQVNSLQKAQTLLLEALMMLSGDNPKAYSKIQQKLKECSIEGTP